MIHRLVLFYDNTMFTLPLQTASGFDKIISENKCIVDEIVGR